MFMATAAGCNDRVERMKYVISMAVAGLHLSNSQGKPFNPLLGETCEAYWPDGSQIFAEHVSHHPAISVYEILGNGFKIYGSSELNARFKGNTMIGGENG